jgi:transposase
MVDCEFRLQSIMMGRQQPQKELFSYQIDLDRRVRADNPLRQVAALMDFSFARAEVESTYGHNGNVSVDPAVILKMMFLLFFDNVGSERQLMEILPERLDYLWFLGYGLNDSVPNHSVLSKARARWGGALFEKLFVRTVAACVSAGWVDGKKIHMDGSLIAAHASNKSIVDGPPELIAALRQACREQVAKLEEPVPEPSAGGAANQTHLSRTDPDAELARRPNQPSRLSYKQHRVVDNTHGVITAQHTTGGSVAEDSQLFGLIQEHQQNTGVAVETVVADSQYGTAENFLVCADQGIRAHMADFKVTHRGGAQRGVYFGPEEFVCDVANDTYRCPAGETLRRYQRRSHKPAWEYKAPRRLCAQCALRAKCTASKSGRRIQRFERQEELDRMRARSNFPAARKDRRRRQHLMEGSFADATNSHGFKRSRWRRLWRQQIQNDLIAACQNVRILLRNWRPRLAASALALPLPTTRHTTSANPFLVMNQPWSFN